MDNATNTADRVAAALTRKGWSIKRAADESGIPYTSLYSKVKGSRDFTVPEIGVLADALEVHPTILLPATWVPAPLAVAS